MSQITLCYMQYSQQGMSDWTCLSKTHRQSYCMTIIWCVGLVLAGPVLRYTVLTSHIGSSISDHFKLSLIAFGDLNASNSLGRILVLIMCSS